MKQQKQKKRALWLACFAVLLSAMVLLAGCTPAGNEYLKLSKEIGSLEQYTFEGDMQMKMDMSSLLAGEEITAEDQEVLDMLENITVTYEGSAIMADGLYDMKMNLKMGDKINAPIQIYMKGMTILISTDDLIGMMEQFGDLVELTEEEAAAFDAEIAKTKEVFAGVKWIDLYEVDAMLSGMDILQNIDYLALNKAMYAALDYLNQNSFKEYQPDVFQAKGAGYEMVLNAKDLQPLTVDFIRYVVSHYDAIVDDLTVLVGNLNDSQLAPLGLSKADLLELLNQLPAELTDLSEEDYAALTEILDMLSSYLKDSYMTSYVEKTGNNTYVNNAEMKLAFADPTDATMSLDMYMDINMTINAAEKAVVDFPTTGIGTISDIAADQQVLAVTGSFFLGDDQPIVFWNKQYDVSLLNHAGSTEITVKEVDGYNYLKLREFAELFDMDLTWDEAAQKAYVTVNGEKVEMSVFVQDGYTYIKFRELEKLGYTVDYDAEFQEVFFDKAA